MPKRDSAGSGRVTGYTPAGGGTGPRADQTGLWLPTVSPPRAAEGARRMGSALRRPHGIPPACISGVSV